VEPVHSLVDIQPQGNQQNGESLGMVLSSLTNNSIPVVADEDYDVKPHSLQVINEIPESDYAGSLSVSGSSRLAATKTEDNDSPEKQVKDVVP